MMIVALHIAAALISFTLLLVAISRREAKHSLYFTFTVLAIFLFNLGYLVEISSITIEVSVLVSSLNILGYPLFRLLYYYLL